MHSIKLIVTDLDNTLLRSDKTLSDYTAGVLNRCRRANIQIAFATARPERMARGFAVEPDYVISNNGAAVSRGGAALCTREIPPDTAHALLGELRDCRAVTQLSAEVGHCLYINYNGPIADKRWNPVYHDFQTPVSGRVEKITTCCADAGVIRAILSGYPALRCYANSDADRQQITRRDASKLDAVRFITGSLGLGLADVAAFGDDYNDVELLGSCGAGVAVGNAIPEAKAAAGAVCGTNDEDGPAHWIEEHLLGH